MAADAHSRDSESETPSRIRAAWLLAVAALTVVVIEGILWVLTRLFILNFDVAGPNATIGIFLLLSTGWVLAPLARVDVDNAIIYAASGGILVVGFLVSLASSALVAGLGAIVMVTAATPILVGLTDALRERVAIGVGLGVLLAGGLRVWLVTAPPYATTIGTALLGLVVVFAAAVTGVLAYRGDLPGTDWQNIGPAPVGVGTLLIIAAGFLAHPQAIARWSLRSYELSVVALVAGVAIGLLVLHVRPVPEGPEFGAWLVAFLASVVVVLYVAHPAALAAFALAWASALVILAAASTRTTDGSGAGALAGFQFLALMLLFFTVAATHWAFLPAALRWTEGTGTIFTVGFHAVFVLGAGYAYWRSGAGGAPAVSQSRRSAIASVGTGILPLAGLAATRPDPGVDGPRDGSTIRVMAFNVHLFIEEYATGQFSLGEIRDVIDEDGADVISMPESDTLRPLTGYVDGVRWLGNELGYYTAFGAPTSWRSYGAALISRWPIENVESFELPIGRSLTRVAVRGRVTPPNGESFTVVSTHFMLGEERTEQEDQRAEQGERILELASRDERTVVLGDFNIRPEEDEYDVITGEDGLIDAWDTLPESERSGTDATYSPTEPQDRIDYIFLTNGWDIARAKTIAAPKASDHMALAADISWSGNGSD